MTPLPWVARILPQRLVLPDLQNLHSLHSGVLENVRLVVQGCRNCVLESDNIVANLYVCNALADRLNDTGALVTEDNGECALWILSRECVGICCVSVHRA
jgi:hypothetical protein